MKMRAFGRLLPIATALQRLDAAVTPIRRTERVSVASALGRVAARTYRAPSNVPAFARATWDGYALRSSDTRPAAPGRPVKLRLIGEVYAEESLGRDIRSGEAVAIATGAAVPPGADAVVIFEETRVHGRWVRVPRLVRPGERIAAPGDDFHRGARLVSKGGVLDPASLGALAATGTVDVSVYRRPVVTVIPNGNELVPPGGRLQRGQIFETNNVTLGALLGASGAEPRAVRPVRDDPHAIERAIRRGLRSSDLVIVTGGSSVGEHDFLPAIFPRVGRLLFHGIAVRPGKPTLAAQVGSKLLIGMPGHPTSCLSNSFWLLLPIVRKLARLPGPGWIEGTAVLGEPVPSPSRDLATVVPLHVDRGVGHLTFRDSSAITSLAGANAFALLPPGSPALAKGTPLPVRYLPSPLGAPPAPRGG